MPASTDAVPAIPTALLSISVDDTIGATLLATFFALLFYGISLNQLYRYLRRFPTDDRFVQVIEGIYSDVRLGTPQSSFSCSYNPYPTRVSETVHCVSTMHLSYFMAVSSLAQELTFVRHGLWSLKAIAISSAPIIFVTQMFFARRVWLVGPQYRLIMAIGVAVLLIEFGMSQLLSQDGAPHAHYLPFRPRMIPTGFGIGKHFRGFYRLARRTDRRRDDYARQLLVTRRYDTGGVRWLVAAGLTTAFATDLLFTPTLTVAIWRSRRGQKGNNSVAELFNTYVINTGLLHCIVNGAASITCLTTSPYSLVYGIPQMTASRLYANSLLSALNSRDSQKGPTIFDSGSYGRNLIQRMNQRAAAQTWNAPQIPDEPSVIHINVTTENEGARRDSAFKRGLAVV
ncbi:hypothetical protein GSI_12196 [Ganoderma sinense ZZ0214-1]|uniref:DUF6534 domain-containing protein n=1 Tax=Ganoderma sinense ZZ0214-1 TaxID=1077348 RepID=A0A2G8RYP1_9APHY|nr:hypothetical protein GSI_12196 [Ganoderma sinense ZZ0214-1]